VGYDSARAHPSTRVRQNLFLNFWLLYAEGHDAINYAQAAHAAARLINKSVEDLDSVRIRPMIDELVFKKGDRVEDSVVSYWR
jgi:hypothetical protein